MRFASFPSYAELMTRLDRLVRDHPRRLRWETIGTSAAGEDVRAVHVGRGDGRSEDKEVAVIVCGRHGDEVGTRVVGPALLEWLLSADAAPVRARQHVIVVPVANPDGCARGEFGLPPDRLPFRLEGTFRPLRSVRDVIRGKIAGAVLDGVQYEAIQALPSAEKMTVAHTSPDLPSSPVIWFGEMDDAARQLRAILLSMKEDPDAKTLLKLLQTDGFGPADPDLPGFRRATNAAVCFP